MICFTRASAFALAFVLAVGCTKLGQQDPYADKSDDIRNAVQPETKAPKAPKPVASDALRIKASDYYSFKEGQEGQITLEGTVLEPVDGRIAQYGNDFTIEIVNLTDFPGATWDPMKAAMTWKPAEGFVDREYSRNMRMLVRLMTKFTPILAVEKEIKVFVIRSERSVEIVSVDDLDNQWTREGERRKFTVVVKDPDSMDADNMRPRLMVVSVNQGSLNASGYVYEFEPTVWNEKNPTQDPLDPTKWVFTMVLDLKDKDGVAREVTKNLETFQFGLIAASRYGDSSAPKIVDAPIATVLRDPVTSWIVKEPIELIAGQENTYNFTVSDLNGEATVTVFPTRCDLLPGKPSCLCVDQDREKTSQLCTIRWNPPANEIGKVIDVKGEIISESRVQNDPMPPKKTKLLGRVKIMKGADPAPQPAPATSVPVEPAAETAGGA
ncbi:MAG: hypothetical protein AAB250_16370 [Bdellovibrionota bacterium]